MVEGIYPHINGGYFMESKLTASFLLFSCIYGYASEPQPEKPGYWQRFKAGTTSAKEAVKGAGATGVGAGGTRLSGGITI